MPAWSPRRLAEGFVGGGFAPNDTASERLRKATLTLAIGLVILLSPVWVVTYLVFDRPLSAAIPAAYIIVSAARLAHLFTTKRSTYLVAGQSLLFLALPFALQWSLGGFERGSAVALWALLAPLAALVAWGWRVAVWIFAAFVAAMIASGLAEGWLHGLFPPLPGPVVTAFWVLNLGAPSATAFFLLAYFLRERDAAAARSEELLLNVLPASVAERLKAGSAQIADAVESASVVFIDIVSFTAFANRTPAGRLVVLLGRVFSALDELVDRHGLEKIKTLGDGYLAVAGVPTVDPGHAAAAARMALAARHTVRAALRDDWPDLELRIGIASGPLVAGVIGLRRFSFDLWGDTVNTASRMASLAEPGSVQITERTRALLGPAATVEARGQIAVKGKGHLTAFRLLAMDGPTPPYSR